MVKSISFEFIFPCLIFAALLINNPLNAQNLKKVKGFRPGKIENVAVDRLGDFFLVFGNGTIKKYDANGKVLASLKGNKSPTLIEPWYHPRIFKYDYRDRTCIIYDRNFQNGDVQPLDPSIAIDPILVCPTNDNQLIVLDRADFSIKRVNPASQEVTAEFYIDTVGARLNVTYLREYQNLIFLLDKNHGIIIYNKEGKKINRLRTNANNFGFFGEELYFLQHEKIIFFDLYTEKTRELRIADSKFILVSDERILLVDSHDQVSIFEFSTEKLPDSN